MNSTLFKSFLIILICSNYVFSQCLDSHSISIDNVSLCNSGQVTLTIDTQDDNYLWYASQESDSIINRGNFYVTPILNQTTSYWISKYQISNQTEIINGIGRELPEDEDQGLNSNNKLGLKFTADQFFKLKTVDVYVSTQAEDLIIELLDMNNNLINSKTLQTVNGSRFSATKITVELNFDIQPGEYKLVTNSGPGMLISYDTEFPYNISYVGQIDNGVGSARLNSTYYYFYNWNIEVPQIACFSNRQEVVAQVNNIIPAYISSTSLEICNSDSVTLTVVSDNQNYEYIWMPGNLTGSSITVSPNESTLFTVTATDTLTNCQFIEEQYISVVESLDQSEIQLQDLYVFLNGTIRELSATEQPSSNLNYDFNFSPQGWQVVKNNVNDSVFWENVPGMTFMIKSNDDSGFFLVSPSRYDFEGEINTMLVSPEFSLVNVSDASINFFHFYYQNQSQANAFVEISVDGGVSYQELKSYNSQEGDSFRFKNEIISLQDYLGESSVRIRFRLTGQDAFYWGIDNIQILGGHTNSTTWYPFTNLYIDQQATIPYNGESINKVFFKSNEISEIDYVFNIENTCESISKYFTIRVIDRNFLSNSDDLKENKTKIFPNPVVNEFTISSDVIIDKYSIYNQLGQLVKESKPNDFNSQVNLSDLSKGIYYVKIHSEQGINQTTIIKS